MISFKAAPLCGEVTFDPADGTALFAGSKVTVACENAAKIFYMGACLVDCHFGSVALGRYGFSFADHVENLGGILAKLMGGKNGSYRNAISYSEGGELPQAITITDASDLAVMTINAVAENKYSIVAVNTLPPSSAVICTGALKS